MALAGALHDRRRRRSAARKTRPSRIPPLPKAVIETVVTRTLGEPPPDGVTHWTAPAMAATSGLSVSSVQRIWRAHGLRPHQVRSLKLSTDPNFATKVEDIVGLYVDPPAHAVLSIERRARLRRSAYEEGPRRDGDPRLQTQRHDHAIRGP
jgi:hypothetical protein